jgi:integrase
MVCKMVWGGVELLTDLKIKKLKAADGLVCAGVVRGLYFKASTPGRGKWVLRFVSPDSGKRRDMGLGTYPDVSIARAREAARVHRGAIELGRDPLDAKRQVEREARAAVEELTFEAAAREVHKEVTRGFKSRKHAAQWLTTLESYVFPHLGNRKVSTLRATDFAEALREIWLSKPETASRVKQRCAHIMDWCVARDMTAASPVSAVSKLLAKQPGKSERVAHQPAVPWQKVPGVLTSICRVERPSPARRVLEVLILTGCRSGEVRGMHWSEIDFDNKIWTIPGTRMKAKQPHRVPLCDRVMEILADARVLQLHDELVFPSARGTPLGDMALTKLLRDQKVPSGDPDRIATAHGFRSSFRDWASEHNYNRDLAEKALAHTVKNRVEAAYHRTDLLELRRPMMEVWGAFVSSSRPEHLS